MKKVKQIATFLLFQLVFGAMIAPYLILWGPFSGIKAYAVGSVITSRHPQFIKLFLNEEQVREILRNAENDLAGNNNAQSVKTIKVSNADGITVEDIFVRGYRGKVMLIKDPRRVNVVTTSSLGDSGQRVSEMAKQVGAVAAINGGGFNDPNGKGNGAFPMGAVIHNGKLIYDDSNGEIQDIIGIDQRGKLVVDKLTANEALSKGITECVNFFPQLVKDGKGVVTDSIEVTWGIGPRTAIGQLRDGTIMFVVIDGRQFQSVGATMRGLEKVFLAHGAVTAANLDGGSSTTMYYNGAVINKPADIFGERYIPTAFIIKPL